MIQKRYIIAPFLVSVFAICACKGTREIIREVPVYVHDTTERVREVHDTTEREVVRVVEQKGDTVFITQTEKERTSSHSTDTLTRTVEIPVEVEVPVPYPVEVEVEKPLTAWQKMLMWIGGIGLLVLMASITWKIKRWWIKVKGGIR